MRGALLLICSMSVLLSSCAHSRTTEGVAAKDCVVTKPIKAQAPEDTEGGPADPELYSWYTNADRSIWMLEQNWVPGEKMKIAWFRPARTKLEVRGRRLDGAAPALFVETSPSGEEYRHRFQTSIMMFPTEGCWEIVAKAGQSEARFVIQVPAKGEKGAKPGT